VLITTRALLLAIKIKHCAWQALIPLNSSIITLGAVSVTLFYTSKTEAQKV